MSDVLERIAALEGDLRGFVFGGLSMRLSTDEVNAGIHRHTMLVARHAFAHGTRWQSDYADRKRREFRSTTGSQLTNSWSLHDAEDGAVSEFPLPPKRVLREEPDPCNGDVEWRWSGALEFRPYRGVEWVRLVSDQGFGRTFAPYPERIDLWHSLKHTPYREVPDNGDE